MNKDTEFSLQDDIHIGQATLIWANAHYLKTRDGKQLIAPAGWVIPGGRRVFTYSEAFELCKRMAKLIGDNYQRYNRPMRHSVIHLAQKPDEQLATAKDA